MYAEIRKRTKRSRAIGTPYALDKERVKTYKCAGYIVRKYKSESFN